MLIHADVIIDMPQWEYEARFCRSTYPTARSVVRGEGESRELSDSVADDVLSRFVAGQLEEETARKFEEDDEKDTFVVGYLKAAVRHAAIDRSRKAHAERKKREAAVAQAPDIERGDGPPEVAARNEAAELVRDAVDRLKPDLRIAVELHYSEGLTCEAIAKKQRKPIGTVTYHLSRARLALKDALTEVIV
jgi:RNA polymerase sigma factor (sigma-70 family)